MNLYNSILFLSMCLLRANAQEPAPGEEAHEHEHEHEHEHKHEHEHIIYHQHETPISNMEPGGIFSDHVGDIRSSVGLLEAPGREDGRVMTVGTVVNAETGTEIGHAVYNLKAGILTTVHYKHPSDHDGHDHDRRRTEEHCETTNIIAGGTGPYLGKAGYVKVCKEGEGFTHEMEFEDPSVSPTVTLDFTERNLNETDVMDGNITALGDRQIRHNVLYDESNTKETGHIVGSGFVVGTDPVVRHVYTAAYDLEDGIITVVGHMSPGDKCSELVVVGGKGAYTNAKGTATVCKGNDADTYAHSVKLSDAEPMAASVSIREVVQEEVYSYHTTEDKLMPGDTISFNSKIYDGEDEIGAMYGHITLAGRTGTGNVGHFLYEFDNGDKLVMIGDPASEEALCGRSAIVGGSGKYLGAMGSLKICSSSANHEYDHTLSLEDLSVASATSGAVMRNAGLFAQMLLFMAHLLII